MKAILNSIISDTRYAKGIVYGKPRKGHSEGSISAHIAELEGNLVKIIAKNPGLLSVDDVDKLRILIHVHDTFKLWATRDSSIDDPNSHASLAAKFLTEFTDDKDLIAMVQWHDENFSLWKQLKRTGKYNEFRLQTRVIDGIEDVDLYGIFTVIDGCTESKLALAGEEKPDKLRWFLDQVNLWKPTPHAYKALETLMPV